MSSSKFSSPFFQKSPLLGAYSSGAGGMITISNAADIQNQQDGIVGGTLAAIGGAKERAKVDDQVGAKNALDAMANSTEDEKKAKQAAQNKYNITYNKGDKCDGYASGTIIGTGANKITCP